MYPLCLVSFCTIVFVRGIHIFMYSVSLLITIYIEFHYMNKISSTHPLLCSWTYWLFPVWVYEHPNKCILVNSHLFLNTVHRGWKVTMVKTETQGELVTWFGYRVSQWLIRATDACFLIFGLEYILLSTLLKKMDPDFSSEESDTQLSVQVIFNFALQSPMCRDPWTLVERKKVRQRF